MSSAKSAGKSENIEACLISATEPETIHPSKS